jgi:hypothetical protein
LIGSVAQHLNIPYFALVMYCEIASLFASRFDWKRCPALDAIFEQTEKAINRNRILSSRY